jgi:hypothetical protein
LQTGSDFEDDHSDSAAIIVKLQPLPLSCGSTQENPDVEDEDVTGRDN